MRRHARYVVVRRACAAHGSGKQGLRRIRGGQRRRARAPKAFPFPQYRSVPRPVLHAKRQRIRPLARQRHRRPLFHRHFQRTIHAWAARQHEHLHLSVRRQPCRAGRRRQAVPIPLRSLFRKKRLQGFVLRRRRRHHHGVRRVLRDQARILQIVPRRAAYRLPAIVQMLFARGVPAVAIDGARLQLVQKHRRRAFEARRRRESGIKGAAGRNYPLRIAPDGDRPAVIARAFLRELHGIQKRTALFVQMGRGNRFLRENGLRRIPFFNDLPSRRKSAQQHQRHKRTTQSCPMTQTPLHCFFPLNSQETIHSITATRYSLTVILLN